MSKKNIGLVVAIIIIIGAIWYIDGTRAHPGAAGNGAAPQAINVGAAGTAPAAAGDVTATSSAAGQPNAALQALAAADQKEGYEPAKEIVDPTGFVNASSSFRLSDLIGKDVVLLDFWTYSCINCIRTLPYLMAWQARYQNEGFTVVGIHTPEFDFEKDIANVQAAVTKYGITYPVVLDSDYGTWTAYGNLYWPHEYLIDLAGYIVHDQIGEGNYSETETEIQKLLAQRSEILGAPAITAPTSTVFVASSTITAGEMSPETYFGAARNEYLGNGTQGAPGVQSFVMPSTISVAPSTLYLGGTWDMEQQYAQTAGPAEIEYQYQAKGAYFVAGSADGSPIAIEVLRDGQPIDKSVAGADIFYQNGKSYVAVGGDRLYRIIDDAVSGIHTLQFIIPSSGLQAFTFTFG